MRDLEIRGAGNLLGDEQSGHVAAVGFELYCQMLDEAVEELRAGATELPAEPREPVRLDVDVDAYLPADYIPFEAAKIDVHRRVAAAREPGELRALRDELEDRFGPAAGLGREPARPAARPDRARATPGRAASSSAPAACGSSPVELDSERVAALNERLPEAIYQWRERTIAVPVPEEAGRAPRRAAGARRRARRGHRIAGARHGLSADLDGDGYAAAPVNRGFFSKRNMAILFGATLVLMVVIVAVAVGVGHPSVPSDDVAVIDDSSINVPGLVENGHISKANFNRSLLQTAKQSGVQTVPQPSDPQYKQIKDQTMQTDLQIAWLVGEASRQGLSFTDTQVQQSLQQIKSQFKTQAEYVKARDQAGLTDADVLERAKLQLIQTKIQDNIQNSVGSVSDSDARAFYDANKSQFKQPAKRTIRIIQNKDRPPDRPRPTRRFAPTTRTRTGRRWPRSTRPIRRRRTRAASAPMSCRAPSSSHSTTTSSRPRPARFRGRW